MKKKDKSEEQVSREHNFWWLNLIGAILAVFSLVFPYKIYHMVFLHQPVSEIYGFEWLWGIAVTIDGTGYIHDHFVLQLDNLIVTLIIECLVLAMLTTAIGEKLSSRLNLRVLRVLRGAHIVLIILAITSIGAGIYELIKAIPPQNPTFTTESISVGSILVFLAGGIAIFSGIFGPKRQNISV